MLLVDQKKYYSDPSEMVAWSLSSSTTCVSLTHCCSVFGECLECFYLSVLPFCPLRNKLLSKTLIVLHPTRTVFLP